MVILMFGISGFETAAASGIDISVISEDISSFGKEALLLAGEVVKAVFGILKDFFMINLGNLIQSYLIFLPSRSASQ